MIRRISAWQEHVDAREQLRNMSNEHFLLAVLGAGLQHIEHVCKQQAAPGSSMQTHCECHFCERLRQNVPKI